MIIKGIITTAVVLFSVIDIIGSLPVIINMKKGGTKINAVTATLTAGAIMIAFLLFGVTILNLFHIEIASFALAGSLVIFFIGLEMTLGIRFFKDQNEPGQSGSIVPIAFPLVAGAGTLTTILSLKATYSNLDILVGITVNLLIVFLVLHSSGWLAKKLPEPAMNTLRKVFGILLLAIAIQMVKNNLL